MFAAPGEGTLKDLMEFGDTGCADHEQSPPHQRTHAAEHYAKLINRNGRYGRFSHASSLPKPTRTAPNLTPRNLPLSGRYRFKHYLSIGSGMAVIAWLLTTFVTR